MQRPGRPGADRAIGDTSSWVPFVNQTGTAPCTNLDRRVEEKDTIGKLNLAYKFDDDRMVYATWSRGFRPGGINRVGTVPPYLSDFLTNYEVGWKTTWAGNRFRWNGALFTQDWEDFQFSFLGQNGLTIIQNANQARINGLEMDATWAVGGGLVLNGGVAFIDSELHRGLLRHRRSGDLRADHELSGGVDSGDPDIGFPGPAGAGGHGAAGVAEVQGQRDGALRVPDRQLRRAPAGRAGATSASAGRTCACSSASIIGELDSLRGLRSRRRRRQRHVLVRAVRRQRVRRAGGDHALRAMRRGRSAACRPTS